MHGRVGIKDARFLCERVTVTFSLRRCIDDNCPTNETARDPTADKVKHHRMIQSDLYWTRGGYKRVVGFQRGRAAVRPRAALIDILFKSLVDRALGGHCEIQVNILYEFHEELTLLHSRLILRYGNDSVIWKV